MATNQHNTRAAVKAQQETAAADSAASAPKTRSKTAMAATAPPNEAQTPQTKGTKLTGRKSTATTTTVPNSKSIANGASNGIGGTTNEVADAGQTQKKIPRCLTCTRTAGHDIRHHYTKCPQAKNHRQLQAESDAREVQITDQVEQQVQSILAARPFSKEQVPSQVPANPPGLASPQVTAPPFFAPPGLAAPQVTAPPFFAPPGLASPQVTAPPLFAPPGLAAPQTLFAPPGVAASKVPRAPPGLAAPQVPAPPLFAQPGRAAPQTIFAPSVATPQVPVTSTKPKRVNPFATFALPGSTPEMPKVPSNGFAPFAPPPTASGNIDRVPPVFEPAQRAPAKGATPFLPTGAAVGSNARDVAQENVPASFKMNTDRRQQPATFAQMPTPAQTPAPQVFTPIKNVNVAARETGLAPAPTLFGAAAFPVHMSPMTPIKPTQVEETDDMQVDEMLVATPMSTAETEDLSPCKGKGKGKKEHGGYIANVWKSTPKGQLQPVLGLYRNSARPDKIESITAMGHDVNPKFQAIIQKATLPMHGLGELRLWENDDMLRDAPEFKHAFRDALFAKLEPFREQRAAEQKKENEESRERVQRAEEAMQEKANEARMYKAQAAKYEEESKRLKKEIRAKEAKKEREKKAYIAKKKALKAAGRR